MKFPWTLVAALVAFYLVAPNQTQALPLSASEENPGNRWSTINEGVIQERLERIPLPFEVRYNAKVRYYIKDYVATGYKQTQSILGRSLMYFPIFEHYLTIRGLPKELMYLPIVESGLNPTAKSPVGAAGLWQLMYSTAKQYGLKINGNVDERLDPYRSTEAAVEMLAELYKEFKDWRLVLAAYNCGPGRVQQAIRAANSRDYWKLEQYLPAQTQRYVPAFVAAAYVVHYYDQHNLRPTYSALNLRETRVLKVYHTLTFQEIASACGLPPATIELLNPGYIRKVVPKNDKGNFLILPANSVAVFKDFLAGKAIANVGSVPSNMFKSTYVVAKGDRIEKLASLFQCSVEDIMKWNGLSEPEVFVNQELIVFLPNQILSKRA
ncbi:MAG TPA: transglycosylase SLT domain-containing protein [Saprospiraceae bacterium]|nr:transglycosylase SLT domain-containing protein [Saprospiraceae bacterium]HMP23625.1 transglycosylase SLT domain-containing protein [Saprospiraceae bacterium]